MPTTVVNKLIHEVIWDDGDAKKKASAWEKQIQSIATPTALLSNAFKKAGSALLSFTVDAGKNFAIYEDALSHARRTMGLTREETLLLGDSLMDLSTSFEQGGLKAGISANELAKIAGQLGQLGFSARDDAEAFNGLVATVAKVSVAFGLSSAKAAENLGILQNLYNFSQDEFSNVASSIAYLGNTTVASAGQILDIMTRVGSMAGLLGVSAQDMAGIAASLREAGVSTQVGGTAMSQIFSRLASDVDKFGEVLGAGGLTGDLLRMKIETGDATGALKDVLQAIQNINATEGKIAAIQALKDLGLSGVRVQQTLLALSNNLGGLNANLQASAEAFQENTAVDEAYNAAIDNTYQSWNQFKNILDVIVKFIGKDVATSFSSFIQNHLIPFTTHFKEWLQTSEGAKAIFGQGGYIDQAFQYFGNLLTDNEDKIFDFFDNIDDKIPAFAEFAKNAFSDLFQQAVFEAQPLIETFTTILSGLEQIAKGVNWLYEQWGKLEGPLNILKEWQTLNKQSVKDIIGAGGPITDIFEDITDAIYGVNQAAEDMNDVIARAGDIGQALGDTMVYHSVLPDITKATIEATRKTVEWGESYAGLTGHTKELYRTGQNTFSNLKKEVESYHQVFERSEAKALSAAHETQFALYQTADIYANTLTPAVVDYTTRNQKLLALQNQINEAYAKSLPTFGDQEAVNTTMAGTGKALGTIGNFKNLSVADLTNLSRSGVLGPSGMMAAENAKNDILNKEFQAQTTDAYQEAKTMNVTVVAGDQEIMNLVGRIDTAKREQQQRTFGSQGRGLS